MLTPKEFAEVRVVSLRSPTVGEAMVEYNLDKVITVGALRLEEFAICIRSKCADILGYRISIDGRDIQTAREASIDPNIGRYWVLPPFKTARHSVWTETQQGGARFIFTDEHLSVASNTPGMQNAKGYITVTFFQEDYPNWPEETESWGADDEDGEFDLQKDYGQSWGHEEPDLQKADLAPEVQLGVGAGTFKQERIHSVQGLYLPCYDGDFVTFRYLAWSGLLDKLNARNYPVPSSGVLEQSVVPLGFVSSGADLRGVPRVTNTVAYEKYPRTEPLNW